MGSGGWEVRESCQNGCGDANLVFIFGSRELLDQPAHLDYLRSRYPVAEFVGCSTAGEICRDEVCNLSIVSTAVKFEKTPIRIEKELITEVDESFSIGEKLARKLDLPGLSHVMILSEGLNINGSELTKGLNARLKGRVPVTGGLAGDQAEFSKTVLVHNETVDSNLVIAIGFYGEHIRVGYGSMSGWDSFGVDRLVTRSKANILYELDGLPALELYKQYLGDHAENLPASALLFPLSLRFNNSDTALVRTILSVNETDGSMVFAGDIPEGEYVRLMKANFEKLIGGAYDAAESSGSKLGNLNPDLAILISCVGRKLVLKQRVDEEVEMAREVFGNETMLAGFYSYGEICPFTPFGQNCELHNQTMTITAFKEV